MKTQTQLNLLLTPLEISISTYLQNKKILAPEQINNDLINKEIIEYILDSEKFDPDFLSSVEILYRMNTLHAESIDLYASDTYIAPDRLLQQLTDFLLDEKRPLTTIGSSKNKYTASVYYEHSLDGVTTLIALHSHTLPYPYVPTLKHPLLVQILLFSN